MPSAGTADRLLLLDTASLYFRAFFGVPDSVRAPDGTPVNAVRGLLDFITRLCTQYSPTHLACCWDEDWRPQWRVDLIPTYKAHRVVTELPGAVDVEQTPGALEAQVPVIREVLAALGAPVVGAPGYEADDVIGTLATDAGMPVDIVTGDRDLFQLVDDAQEVRVLYTARGVGKHEVLTDPSVVRRYGILPEQYADYATLRGDSSDGLPGVAGVGEKTAAGLLAAHGDLQSIIAAAADGSSGLSPTVRRRITEAADYLRVAPTVVAVCRELDLGSPDLSLPDPVPADAAGFERLTERWGLGSSAERVVTALRR
ncbi:MAG TPA: 5'-3' exonuclease [Nocardioidaceae bacterium]|nr:5'-3' exonuclease [Nocardioidaceae bacterium]